MATRLAALGGAVAAAAALLLGLAWPEAAARGWLAAAAAGTAVPAAGLILAMMMRLIPGDWGEEMLLACEAGTLAVPLSLAFFLPVLLALGLIYPWMHAPPGEGLRFLWLTPAAWIAVTLAWFLFLLGFGRLVRARWRTAFTASLGLVLAPPLLTLAAAEWLMSIDPGFASSGFGMQFLAILLPLGFCQLLLLRLSEPVPIARPQVLGGLLLVMLLIWAYFQFLVYFIIWSGNLPDGVGWYLVRLTPWPTAAFWTAAALGGLPLLLLFFPAPRSRPGWLAGIAIAVAAGKLIEIGWMALPPLGFQAAIVYILALAALLLWTAVALRLGLAMRVKQRAPRLEATA